jgi:hypothetical protein
MYTKGKWGVQYCGQGLTNIVLNEDNDDVIAIVDNSRDNHSPYDAEMIAAAPDMYEALKEYQYYNRCHNDEEAKLFDLAMKALAKAEGK